MPKLVGRHLVYPSGPLEQTREIARLIRRHFGWGGASFPGSRELYAAAAAIEEWAQAWDAQEGRRIQHELAAQERREERERLRWDATPRPPQTQEERIDAR